MNEATWIPPGWKTCRECGEAKPRETGFLANAGCADGYRVVCRDCVNAARRAAYARNPEPRRAARRADYAANTENELAAQREWREANPEKVADRHRRYRVENRDAIRERARARHRERRASG